MKGQLCHTFNNIKITNSFGYGKNDGFRNLPHFIF